MYLDKFLNCISDGEVVDLEATHQGTISTEEETISASVWFLEMYGDLCLMKKMIQILYLESHPEMGSL